MNSINLTAWAKDAEDYTGKDRDEVVIATVNGKRKPMTWAQLKTAVKLNLPMEGEDDEPADGRLERAGLDFGQ